MTYAAVAKITPTMRAAAPAARNRKSRTLDRFFWVTEVDLKEQEIH